MEATAINAAAVEMTEGEIAAEAKRLDKAVRDVWPRGWAGVGFFSWGGWSCSVYDNAYRSLCEGSFPTAVQAFAAAWAALEGATGARPSLADLAATLGSDVPK